MFAKILRKQINAYHIYSIYIYSIFISDIYSCGDGFVTWDQLKLAFARVSVRRSRCYEIAIIAKCYDWYWIYVLYSTLNEYVRSTLMPQAM